MTAVLPTPAPAVSRLPAIDVAIVPALLALAVLTLMPTGTDARALAVLSLGSLVTLAFSRDPFSATRQVRWGMGLLAALACWYLVSRAWALAPGGSMTEAARWAAFVMFAWSVFVAASRSLSRWVLVLGVAVVAACAAAPELWHALIDGAPPERVIGRLGYWNASGIVALILVPASAMLVAAPARHRAYTAPLAGVLVAASAAAAAATASRGALLAAVLSLVVLAACSPQRMRVAAAATIVGVGVVAGVIGIGADAIEARWTLSLVAVLVALVAWFVSGRFTGERFAPEHPRSGVHGWRSIPRAALVSAAICTVVGVLVVGTVVKSVGTDTVENATTTNDVGRLATTSDSNRLDWWSASIDQWQGSWLAGAGGDAFEAARFDTADAAVPHTHSLPLQVLVETGIVGIALLLVAAGVLFVAALGASRTSHRAFGAAVLAMVVGQTLVDWTWSIPQVMAVTAIALALVLPRPLVPSAGQGRQLSLPVVLGTMVVFALLGCIALVPFAAELLADQSASNLDANKPRAAADSAHQSMQLLPAFDTLQFEVIALELADDSASARAALTKWKPVWSARPEGLSFAHERLGEDPDLGPWIRKRQQQMAVPPDHQPIL